MAVKRKERPKNTLPWWAQRRVGCKRNTPNPIISPSSPLKKKEEELLVPSPMAVRWNELPKNTLPCWRRRVGCKRSTPNPMISPPLKKKKKKELLSYEDQKENILDQEPKKKATTGGINAEAVDSSLKKLCINQEDIIPDLEDERTTADPNLSGARNNWSMSVRCGTTKTHLSAEVGNSYFTDSKEQKVIPDQEVPKMGATPVNGSMAVQYNSSKTLLYLLPTDTNFLAEAGDSHLPGSHTQGKTIVGSNDDELASDAESRADVGSRADRWACRVCKEAVVSIAVLPCSHLCLCWDCEFEIDHCPVCGEPKTDCFYTRSP